MRLILKDGTIFEGESFGAKREVSGEVVFNTGMVGYVESLTDPSYEGQILVLTYPLIGNYGVPGPQFFESTKIRVAGLVVSEYSETYSSHTAKESLANWLRRSGVPAITGVDTRALTKKLREHGVMLGCISAKGAPKKFVDPNERNLVADVSIKRKKVYGSGFPTIVAVDCGMKENIIRSFIARGAKVIRVPWDYDFNRETYDGLFLSNGPGDPVMCTKTVEHITKAMKKGKPILGICLGTQLLALAAGASTYKLKYGHRSQNQPCCEVWRSAQREPQAHRQTLQQGQLDVRCYITSQNHGYAVDAKTLPKEWSVWFTNMNDGSVEGIRHASMPWKAVQFHPEASPGPTDTAWVFDEFLAEMKKLKRRA